MKARRVAWILTVGVAACAIALFAYRLVWASHSGAKAEPHSVTLTWDASPGASSYNVYRSSKSGGPYDKVGTASTPKYVDKPVASGAVLYYVVTTVTDKGESKYSAEIKAVVP
jgi:fibronectin type 3 domain-containing protein